MEQRNSDCSFCAPPIFICIEHTMRPTIHTVQPVKSQTRNLFISLERDCHLVIVVMDVMKGKQKVTDAFVRRNDLVRCVNQNPHLKYKQTARSKTHFVPGLYETERLNHGACTKNFVHPIFPQTHWWRSFDRARAPALLESWTKCAVRTAATAAHTWNK